MLTDKRIYLQTEIKRLAIHPIQPLLIRTRTPPGFAANDILRLRHNPRFGICDNRRNDTNRFGAHFPECIQIPTLRGASFAHFPLCSDMR
jgi:hypothetical protein